MLFGGGADNAATWARWWEIAFFGGLLPINHKLERLSSDRSASQGAYSCASWIFVAGFIWAAVCSCRFRRPVIGPAVDWQNQERCRRFPRIY